MTTFDLRDSELLESIKPLDLSQYLRSKGWEEEGKPDNWARLVYGQEFEVMLPLSTDFYDYKNRIADVLKTLLALEQRSIETILHDIRSVGTDTIRIHVGDSDARDGTLSIDGATELIARARDMVLAAACFEVAPKMYYPSRKPVKANNYMQKVRMGQTERGSFVLTIISPVAPSFPENAQESLHIEDPFERKVTRRLSTSLTSLKDAISQSIATNTISAFESAVQQGVSANLVDAVLGLSNQITGNKALAIDFSWATARPVLKSNKKILITHDSVPLLEEVVRIFKAKAPREEYELRGPVINLRRADPDTKGEVTVVGVIDGHPRRVIFELSGDDYRTAIRAHEQNKELFALGLLMRDGRMYILHQPRGLEIVEEETD